MTLAFFERAAVLHVGLRARWRVLKCDSKRSIALDLLRAADMWHISALSRTDDEMVGGPIVMPSNSATIKRLRQFENTLRVRIPTLRCMGIVVEIAAHPH